MNTDLLQIIISIGASIFVYHKYIVGYIDRKLDKELYYNDKKTSKEFSDKMYDHLEKKIDTIKDDVDIIKNHILNNNKH